MARLRVLHDVRERLLGHAIEEHLDRARQPRRGLGRAELDGDVRPVAEALGQPLQRRYQAEVVEHRRPQQLRHRADLLHQPDHLLAHLADPLPQWHRSVVHGALDHRQVHLDRGQHLANAVVELARQTADALFLQLHAHAGELPELGLVATRGLEERCVCERGRGLARQCRRELDVGARRVRRHAADDDTEQLVLEDERQDEGALTGERRAGDDRWQGSREGLCVDDRRSRRRRAEAGEVDRLGQLEAAAGVGTRGRVRIDDVAEIRGIPEQHQAR